MTFTVEFDLYRFDVNHRAKCQGQTLFRSKVIVRTCTHAQPNDCYTVALQALKSGEGYFGVNVNVGAKSRDVCKEQFYCS